MVNELLHRISLMKEFLDVSAMVHGIIVTAPKQTLLTEEMYENMVFRGGPTVDIKLIVESYCFTEDAVAYVVKEIIQNDIYYFSYSIGGFSTSIDPYLEDETKERSLDSFLTLYRKDLAGNATKDKDLSYGNVLINTSSGEIMIMNGKMFSDVVSRYKDFSRRKGESS